MSLWIDPGFGFQLGIPSRPPAHTSSLWRSHILIAGISVGELLLGEVGGREMNLK